VTLKVYDLMGRVIREVLHTTQAAGVYSVEVGMANLPSGVYFYKIQAGEWSQVRKMLLVK
jgi:hypothetical protein